MYVIDVFIRTIRDSKVYSRCIMSNCCFSRHFRIININKLHSLQSLVRKTRRTNTANITEHDVTSASHRQKVTVLQK